MTHIDPGSTKTTLVALYRCPSCARCFMSLKEDHADKALCRCGARVIPLVLPSGMHEFAWGSPKVRRAESEAESISREIDVGYTTSHGYEPAHGGPSGPGDAPATTTAEHDSV